MEECIFCKIIKGDIKSEKVFEDKSMIIIKDRTPKSKNHFLLIPKPHFETLESASTRQLITLGKSLSKLPKLKELLGLEKGYRLVINQGEDAGQTVPHLHLHILSGQKMDWNPA